MMPSQPSYWILKTEPSTYSWATLQTEGQTAWTSVRNFEARNNLKAMKTGDIALIYHSGTDKHIVGVATITRAAYPDPTDPTWFAVDIAPKQPLAHPITLQHLKQHPTLKHIELVRKSRLSVSKIAKEEYEEIKKGAQ